MVSHFMNEIIMRRTVPHKRTPGIFILHSRFTLRPGQAAYRRIAYIPRVIAHKLVVRQHLALVAVENIVFSLVLALQLVVALMSIVLRILGSSFSGTAAPPPRHKNPDIITCG